MKIMREAHRALAAKAKHLGKTFRKACPKPRDLSERSCETRRTQPERLHTSSTMIHADLKTRAMPSPVGKNGVPTQMFGAGIPPAICIVSPTILDPRKYSERERNSTRDDGKCGATPRKAKRNLQEATQPAQTAIGSLRKRAMCALTETRKERKSTAHLRSTICHEQTLASNLLSTT